MFRAKASILWMMYSPIFALTTLLPILLLGYWLIVTGAIQNHAQHPKLFGSMARIGLGVGLFVTVGSLIIMGHPGVKDMMSIQAVANVMFYGGEFFMTAGYLGLLIRLLDSPKCYKRFAKLAPMGRMALTNYIILDSVVELVGRVVANGVIGVGKKFVVTLLVKRTFFP